MDRILRSLMQVGQIPDAEDCLKNWSKLQEHNLDFSTVEEKSIYDYFHTFYGQMSAPPDFSIVREFFEKEDKIEVLARLDEVKNAQPYIGTNYLAIVRAEEERQQTRNFMVLMREASVIAEHGRNLDKPVDGKKILKGVGDAVNFVYDHLHGYTRVESGEKLEGVVSDDADEVIQECEDIEKLDKYSGRNLFGLEPVDSICRGHRMGEYWIHTAFAGELKCLAGDATIYDHATNRRRTMKELYESGDAPVVTALDREGRWTTKLVRAQAERVVQNGVRQVFEIKLKSGRRTFATANHKFYTTRRWKTLKEIKKGDFIAIPRKIDIDSGKEFSDIDDVMRAIESMADTDRIPDRIFFLPDDQLARFIAAFWNTDIAKYGKDPKYTSSEIIYHCTSLQFCYDLQALLLRLGINARVFYKKIGNYLRKCDYYHVQVAENYSKRLFNQKIKIRGQEHIVQQWEAKIANIKNSSKSSYEDCRVPKALLLTKKEVEKKSRTKRPEDTLIEKKTLVEKSKKRAHLRKYVNSDLRWDVVESIKKRGKEMTYDLSVPTHHSFVVDDIISHNTSLSLNYAYNNSYVYGKNIFYAILEMPYKQLRRQLYVIHSSHGKFVTDWWKEDERLGIPPDNRYRGLDYRKVRDGELSPKDKERFRIVAQDFKATSKGKLFVWRPQDEATVQDIRRTAEMFHNKYGCDGIVVDHLGLVRPKYRTSDFVTTQNAVVRDGRLMALNFARGRGVPVLALFQMNRQGKLRADKNDGNYDISAISYANECLAEGTLVQTNLGVIPIEKVVPGVHRVWSSSGWKGVLNKFDNGMQPVVKLRTDRGHELRLTRSHVLRTFQDEKLTWNKVSDLKPGDFVFEDLSYFGDDVSRRGRPCAIQSIEEDGESRVWDLEVTGDHEYSTGGLFSHNCEKSADVITWTYLNEQLRKEGKFYLGCLKNRDNPIFERMTGRILWMSKRMRAIESGLIDMNNDSLIISAGQHISQLRPEDLLL